MPSRFQIPNLAYIRQDDKNYEQAFRAVASAINRMSDQGNLDPTGTQVAIPTAPAMISVIQAGGIHDIQITDNAPGYNGQKYLAEYSQTPSFSNFHQIDMGESQNHRANLGAGTYYWRARTKMSASLASDPVYFGGSSSPTAVGSGSYVGPAMQPYQGFAGIYRNSSVPPIRK
jgi:hypothetical protein